MEQFFESICKLVEKNESIILFKEKYALMKDFIKSLNIVDVNIFDKWLEFEIKKYSDCKVESHIPHIVSSIAKDSDIISPVENVDIILEWLKNIPQPEQRTSEWYEYRNSVLTASSLSHIFDKSTSVSYLEYFESKVTQNSKMIKGNALSYGIRNEDNAISIYEIMNNCKVSEYGCIKHKHIDYIGASPDGIITESENPTLLGRMLEIKCLFSRRLTGVPKWNYWVQCQLQMEVCDLPYCDFFECVINENNTRNEFFNKIENKTMKNNYYGIVLEYEDNNGISKYIYSSLGESVKTLEHWFDVNTDQFHENSDKQFIKAYYWTLTKHSLVTIKRNKEWFSMISPNIELFWNNVCNARKQIKENPESAEKILVLENRPTKKIRKKILDISNDVCICDD